MDITSVKIKELIALISYINSSAYKASLKNYPKDSEEIKQLELLNQTLKKHYKIKSEVERKVDEFNATLLKFAQHDYSAQNSIDSNYDSLNSLAYAINLLGEELNYSTVTTYYLNDIFNSMKDILIIIDKQGYIQSVNHACCEVLKYNENELLKYHISDIFKTKIVFSNLINNSSSENIYTLISKDLQDVPVLFSVSHFVRGDEQEIGIVIIARDMTSKLEIEGKLRKSEEKYRTIFENVQDVFFQTDLKGQIFDISPSIKNLTDYERDELIGKSVFSFYSNPNEKDKLLKNLNINGELRDYELKIITKTGLVKYVSVNARLIDGSNGNPNHIDGALRDITERKLAEEELKSTLEKLRQLSLHVEKVREKERVAISRELHDDLGQSLTAVKMDLAMIKFGVSDPDVAGKIDKLSLLMGDTIKTVQRITAQLRPQIIEDLGVKAAIESYINEFKQRFKIEVLLKMESSLDINAELSLIIYRIIQESLTNIARHAKATQVEIMLNEINKAININVTDNGIGITKKEINAKDSFGIISMKERAASYGGSFEIHNGKECGTVINIVLPLH